MDFSSSLPKVSICIPVYNMAETIATTLHSALNQTYQNYEVILADNQSTDATFEIASSIKSPRLRVIRNKCNLGAYGNHNFLLNEATGEWVKFLHGDDDLLPICLDSFINFVNRLPMRPALVACGAIRYDEQEREVSRSPISANPVLIHPKLPADFLNEGNIYGTPTMVFLDRAVLLDLGGFDSEMEPAADWDCWIKIRSRCVTALLCTYLVITRDDIVPEIDKQVRQRVNFMLSDLRIIWKCFSQDPINSDQPIERTIYAGFVCRQMYRYMNSIILFGLRGNFNLLRVAVSSLTRGPQFNQGATNYGSKVKTLQFLLLQVFFSYIYRRFRVVLGRDAFRKIDPFAGTSSVALTRSLADSD